MSKAQILPWNTHFEVGVEEIDTQHRELVKLINETCSCVTSTRNYEGKINGLFTKLLEYTKYHFDPIVKKVFYQLFRYVLESAVLPIAQAMAFHTAKYNCADNYILDFPVYLRVLR